jgi:hypothetical protein
VARHRAILTPEELAERAPLPPADRDPAGEVVLALQRDAGNAAVATLLRTPRGAAIPVPGVMRQPLPAKDDPSGYTQPGGVSDVAKSGTTRLEVRGLKYGVTGGFQKQYVSYHKDGTSTARGSAEAGMTKESPDNMAVVVMPDKVDPKRPVQVILHFHGWGFRGGTDPYAGYTVASGAMGAPHGKAGTVRDVDQEHWEQQIGAVNKARAAKDPDKPGPQTIAILAQGRGMSDFGNVPTFDYVADVFSKVPQLSGISDYTIILSAHSGGGATQIAPKVAAGDAPPADKSKVPGAKAGHAAPMPSDLVVLFDAEGIEATMSWVIGRIDDLAKGIAADPSKAESLIKGSQKFRGYFAKNGAYQGRYVAANEKLCEALKGIPDRWSLVDTVDPGGTKAEDLFRIIKVDAPGVDHEHLISGGTGGPAEAGALADALNASTDPTGDRARALPCSKPRKPTAPKP